MKSIITMIAKTMAVARTMAALTLICAALSFAAGGEAQANPKYASVIMEMETGEILRARNPDKRLYPASLTKMMTLYLAFEAVQTGKLRLDQKIRVSRNASREPPSKLGLRKGARIKVRDAIQACATKSANDAATTLGEAIAGSESAFAAMMTRKAKELGMKRTTFRNAHGLTNRGQKSTARDMAILGRRLFMDFPQYYSAFKRKNFRYGGRNYRATNKLLNSYEGADGIKTGYTNASGFNLVASAKRDGRRILGVVFGGKSSRSRNRHMANLLDMGFKIKPKRRPSGALISSPEPRWHPKRGPAPRIVAMPRPKPGAPSVAVAALKTGGEDASILHKQLKALEQAVKSPVQEQAIKAPAEEAAEVAALNADRGWSVQVGAFRKRHQAERRLNQALKIKRNPLSEATRFVSVRQKNGRPLYRARFAGFELAQARKVCSQLKSSGVDCFPVMLER